MSRNPKQPATSPQAERASLSTASGLAAKWILGQHGWRVLALWMLTFAAYSNSFQAGLIYDNALAILQDTRVHTATSSNVHLILTEEYWYKTSITGLYRPLTTLSYLMNYAMLGNGANSAGYHWVNFCLHALNVGLVYVLALWIGGDAARALAVAALWGVHPLVTESVTNIVGRADLLAACGVLAGLLCHIAATSGTGRGRVQWWLCLAIAATVGIFSKEAGVVLPGVMLLYDLTRPKAASWRSRVPGYAAVALPFAVYFWMRDGVLARTALASVPFGENPLAGAGIWASKLTAIQVIGKYVLLFLWPARLSADYSYDAIRLFGGRLTEPHNIAALVSLALCVGAAAWAIHLYRTGKPLFFAIVFFFLALAPTANVFFVIGSIMAERFMYLPSVGLAACAVAGMQALGRYFSRRLPAAQRAGWAVIAMVCLAFAGRTYARNFDWQNDRTLWTSTVSAYPASFKAHWMLASALVGGSPAELDSAVREAGDSLAIVDGLGDEKSSVQAYAVAGICYRVKGDSLGPVAGTDWYRKALEALTRGARIDAVQREETRRLNSTQNKTVLAPGWLPLYLEMGRTYLRLADPGNAIEALTYGRAYSIDPQFTVELSHAWRAKGDWEQAAIVLIEAMVADGTSPVAQELVDLYRQAAPLGCAIRETGGSRSIDMNCPVVHKHVCQASRNVAAAYLRNGQTAKAAITAQTAVQQLGCPREMFQ